MTAFLDRLPEDFADELLTTDLGANLPDKFKEDVAQALADALQVRTRRGQVGKWRVEIARALTSFGEDPDTALMDWLEWGAPLGITAEIEKRGVFPEIQKEEARPEASRFWSRTADGAFYRSLEEEKEW